MKDSRFKKVSVEELLIKKKKPPSIAKSKYLKNGIFPILDQSNDFISGYTNDESKIISEGLPLVIFGDHTRTVKISKHPFACGGGGAIVLFNSDLVDSEYFYYILKNIDLSNYAYDRHFKYLKVQKVNIFNDISIQKNIAKVLYELDAKIELNQKTNVTLESIVEVLFKSWFIDFDPVKAKLAAKRTGRDPEKAAMAAIACKLLVPPGKPTPENLEEKLPSAEAIDAAIVSLEALSQEQMQALKENVAYFPSDFINSELGLIPAESKVFKVEDLVSRIKVKQKFTKENVMTRGEVIVYEQGSNLILGFHNGDADINSSIDNPRFIFGDHTCLTHLSVSPFSVGPNVIPLSASTFNPYWTYYAVKDIQENQEYRRHWMEFILKKVVVPRNELSQIFGNLIMGIKNIAEKKSDENRTLSDIRDILLPKLLSGEISVASD